MIASLRRTAASVAALGTLLLLPLTAQAAVLELEIGDGPGQGFHDPGSPDPVATAGGNPGQTIGEQRLIAFQFAADLWGGLLDNDITVTVAASMSELECDETSGVLGSAAPTNVYWDPGAELWYPSALADAIAGEDLDPSGTDIEANFNSLLDADDCIGDSSWYYGLDGNPPASDIDFLSTVLHELAHGLGFISFYDYDSGEFLEDGADVFSSMVYDLSQQKYWPELTDEQRAESGRNVRNLVWAGQNVQDVAPAMLPKGYPSVSFTPSVPGFSGALNEADVGLTQYQPVSGEVVFVEDSCDTSTSVLQKIVLVQYEGCIGLEQLQEAGASAVLYGSGSEASPPGDLVFDTINLDIDIPVLHVNQADLLAIRVQLLDGPLQAQFTLDLDRHVGADGQGRVLLNATNPTEYGSSVDHWDALTRRTATVTAHNHDLLMEPAGISAGSGIDLTAAFLADIGWNARYCGNGQIEEGETCDDGEDNSSFEADACRPNCMPASCGDGLVDSNEECDSGAVNGNPGSPCLATCQLAVCGDGMVTANEECDDANNNSDQNADACRTDCTSATCGDGVADSDEDCDGDAFQVEPPTPLAQCLGNCSWAWCGNGRRESGEQCDDGAANGSAASRCSVDCVLQVCGDGIQDGTEECDKGTLNSDTAQNACRSDCTLARCGDTVQDRDEDCDDGNLAGSDGCSGQCEVEPPAIPNAGTDVDPPTADGGPASPGDDSDTLTTSDAPNVEPTDETNAPLPDDDEGTEPPPDTGPSPDEGDDQAPAPTADGGLLNPDGDSAGGDLVGNGIPSEDSGCLCTVGARRNGPEPHYGWLVVLALYGVRRRHLEAT